MTNWPQASIDIDKSTNMCFVCGKDNPIGLKLQFDWDGKTARAEFTPSELCQGWTGIMHGGIIACLLDEAMSYAAVFEKINTITAQLQMRIKRPIPIGEPLFITGTISKRTRRLVETKATILLKDGTSMAEATAKQFVFDAKQSKETDDR